MVYGYARVSTREQNLDRQIIELKKFVDEKNIVVDQQSGKSLKRPGYQALKGALGLRQGDILYVKSLDRLSRSKSDIKSELEWFQKNHIELRVLDLPTTMVKLGEGQEWIRDMVNNILIEVLSSIAEQERASIRQRQREGIDAAKAKGKYLGRPVIQMPDNFEEVYDSWKKSEITAKTAMKKMHLSRTTFYKMVKQWESREKRS